MIERNVTHLPCFEKAGFTLMEVLVSLTIVGMIAVIAAGIVPKGAEDDEAYEATMEIMESLKLAIVGVPPTHLAGERRYTGYIADMGELPELLGDQSQPAGLWTDALSDIDSLVEDLPAWAYNEDARLWVGWHGPYVDSPSGGIIKDGWGNRIVFERFNIDKDENEVVDSEGTNLRFKSLGSDGKEQDETQETSGYEADIVYIVREQDYMGDLAGYLAGVEDGKTGGITIYYPAKGALVSKAPSSLQDDGYFVLEDALPMGIRSLRTGTSAEPLIFSVEPTGNFLGTVRAED